VMDSAESLESIWPKEHAGHGLIKDFLSANKSSV